MSRTGKMALGAAAMWVAIIVVLLLNNLAGNPDNQDASPGGSSDISDLTQVDVFSIHDEIDIVSRDTTEWLHEYKCGNTAGLPDARAVEQRIVDVLADWEQLPATLRTGLYRSDPLLEPRVTDELPEQLSEVRRTMSAGPRSPAVGC